ncbi:MAG: Uma2 family endonuclease [Leptolyngbyaceae cyanobacterium MO_188.B28]|nr:Uma2 family endonuclease [Leptolyngbyaceae cyanobacterium MO_188.B28]
MTTLTHPKSFQELLDYDDGTDNSYELTEGKLKIVAPESEINAYIASCLRDVLVPFFNRRRVVIQKMYVEVHDFPGMPLNREPDLVVLHPNHPRLMAEAGKMAISADMPPPQLIVEVVSPYPNPLHENFIRDYLQKPQQYAQRGIPEFWIIDPQRKLIEVQSTPDTKRCAYMSQATFEGSDLVRSQLPELSDLQITVQEVLEP